MKEGNTFPLGARTRRVVDQPDFRRATARQRGVQIFDREAEMVDRRPALRHETSDRRICRSRLQELYQSVACGVRGDVGSIQVLDADRNQAKNIAIECRLLRAGVHGDPNVRQPRPGLRDVRGS